MVPMRPAAGIEMGRPLIALGLDYGSPSDKDSYPSAMADLHTDDVTGR